MSVSAAVDVAVAEPRAVAQPTPLGRCYRFELTKLLAQWPLRLVLAAAWIAPGVLVAVMSQQSSLPTDTVFGRLMGQSGWAGPLVILGFSSGYVLTVVTSLVAGDTFASEDRLGTWRHLLVAVRSHRRIFWAKTLASLTIILVLVTGLAVSSIVGGQIGVGNRPLLGLDGHMLTPGQAGVAVILSWLVVLAPTLAFAAIGLLGSIAFGRSPLGLILPALLALVLQIAQLMPLPVVVRAAFPSFGFIAWRGLFLTPVQIGPLIISVGVSLILALATGALAYRMFMRRDFTDVAYDGIGSRVLLRAALPLALVFAALVGAIAVATPASGSGISATKLDHSLDTTFSHIYQLQTRELHRPGFLIAQLHTSADCNKGGAGGGNVGAGNDWRCVVTWRLPGSNAVGQGIYQLDVNADGRYVADGDGPIELNGYFVVQTPAGTVPNPMWQFDGTVNLLTKS